MPWRVLADHLGFPASIAAATAATWAVVAWLASTDYNTVGVAITAVGVAVLFIAARVDKFFQDRKKQWDDINKDSLSVQLAEERTRREKSDAESAANQIKMRASLHEIIDQANRNGLEAENLRGQLRTATQQIMDTSRELREANATIVELSDRIAQLQAGVEKMPRLTGAAVGAVVQRALTDSRSDFLAYRPPDAPPAPAEPAPPDPIPGSPSP